METMRLHTHRDGEHRANALWGRGGRGGAPVVATARLYGGPQRPAIAIVDSGVDQTKLFEFGSRVVARANFSSASPGAIGDQLGHRTMVAGVAAGAGGLDGKLKGRTAVKTGRLRAERKR